MNDDAWVFEYENEKRRKKTMEPLNILKQSVRKIKPTK